MSFFFSGSLSRSFSKITLVFMCLYSVGPVSASPLTPRNCRHLLQKAKAADTAEIWSLRHQDDLLTFYSNTRVLHKLGADADALRLGMIDSDRGKLAEYKAVLTQESERSDLLFNVLLGRGSAKSTVALKEALKEAAFHSPHLLNPSLTPSETRAVLREAFMLIGYLHDFPGLIDAIEAHESGVSTTEQFQKRVLANLFHNGPSLGFWGFLTNVLVPGQLEKSTSEKVRRIFAGSVFENETDVSHSDESLVVKPRYPFPRSYEGLLHAVADRLSQGTRGGIVKIYWEIVKFTPPLKAIEDLVMNNPKQTIQQIEALLKYAESAENALTPEQRRNVIRVAQIAIERVSSFQSALLPRMTMQETIEDLDGIMEAVESEIGVAMRALSQVEAGF